jgi:hypothetical protein
LRCRPAKAGTYTPYATGQCSACEDTAYGFPLEPAPDLIGGGNDNHHIRFTRIGLLPTAQMRSTAGASGSVTTAM